MLQLILALLALQINRPYPNRDRAISSVVREKTGSLSPRSTVKWRCFPPARVTMAEMNRGLLNCLARNASSDNAESFEMLPLARD